MSNTEDCTHRTLFINKRIPNNTFEVIDKAGHGAPLSRAPEVNKLIINFLGN